jgi:hypothetical protein
MGTTTSKRGFYKPTPPSETGWGTLLNATLDLLDKIGDVMNYRRIGATPDRWYPAGIVEAHTLSTVAPSANVLRAFPFIVPYNTTLDRIAINVTGALAGNQRMGIYADDGNLHPGNLLLDAGTVDTSGTGAKTLTISQVVTAGTLLWICLVGNAAPTIRALPASSGIPLLGYDNTLGTDAGIGWSTPLTYAALPSTWPTASEAILTAAAAQAAIFVRASV